MCELCEKIKEMKQLEDITDYEDGCELELDYNCFTMLSVRRTKDNIFVFASGEGQCMRKMNFCFECGEKLV